MSDNVQSIAKQRQLCQWLNSPLRLAKCDAMQYYAVHVRLICICGAVAYLNIKESTSRAADGAFDKGEAPLHGPFGVVLMGAALVLIGFTACADKHWVGAVI